MKITINVDEDVLRAALDRIGFYDNATIVKIMASPALEKALQDEAQQTYDQMLSDDSDWLCTIAEEVLA